MKPTLTDVTGIGASTVRDLADGGIQSIEDLANASPSTICAVPGFGAIRAARVKAAAVELLRRSEDATAAESTEPAPEPEAEMTTEDLQVSNIDEDDKPKKKKTGKKDKKDKKGGKEKKEKSKKDKADKKGKSGGKKGKKGKKSSDK